MPDDDVEMAVLPIRHELALRCDATSAFRAYVESIGSWWDPMYTWNAATFDGVTIEPEVGGAVVESHRDGTQVVWGRVTVWEPPSQLGYTSILAQSSPVPSEISVAFHPTATGCTVQFEHGGWNHANAADRARFGDWPLLLARYADVAEAGPPEPA